MFSRYCLRIVYLNSIKMLNIRNLFASRFKSEFEAQIFSVFSDFWTPAARRTFNHWHINQSYVPTQHKWYVGSGWKTPFPLTRPLQKQILCGRYVWSGLKRPASNLSDQRDVRAGPSGSGWLWICGKLVRPSCGMKCLIHRLESNMWWRLL